MTFNIDDFLIHAHKAGASDVHLNCTRLPSLRIKGQIYKINQKPLDSNDIQEVLRKTIPEEYSDNFKKLQNIDYVYEIKNVARYRVNYCKDVFNGKLTFRTIPYKIKSVEELALPKYLENYTHFNNGIVLITGATGSGKSTTIASLIELINKNYPKHIVTIEDPVEFVYEEKKAIITQRSLEIDVKDFKTGIKYALRQDPDVILVGEIRDKDTLLSAIEASETGHLVFSTLHTNGAIDSINRLRGFLEESGQEIFTKRLAQSIRGIMHQQLVQTVDNKIMPATELLTFTSTVKDYIKDGKFNEIYFLMQKTKQENMHTMNSSLFDLYSKGIITKEMALEYSFEKTEMEQYIRGIYRTSGDDIEDSIL